VILTHTLTEATGDDATIALDLINAVEGQLASVTADAAYDTVAVYEAARARHATVVMPRSDRRMCLATVRGRPRGIGRSRPCSRSDGAAGSGCRGTIVRLAWRTRASATSRSSETGFEPGAQQAREVRPSWAAGF
jgi:hypothetical protein